MIDANLLARKHGKVLCVETLGELVKQWRLQSGLRAGDLATLVNEASGTSREKPVQRQHIEQMEKAGNRRPRYILELAKVMGTTVENLMALKMPPPFGMTPKGMAPAPAPRLTAGPPANPPPDFADRPNFTVSDWSELTAMRAVFTPAQIEHIKALAALKLQESAGLVETVAKKASFKRAPETGDQLIGGVDTNYGELAPASTGTKPKKGESK